MTLPSPPTVLEVLQLSMARLLQDTSIRSWSIGRSRDVLNKMRDSSTGRNHSVDSLSAGILSRESGGFGRRSVVFIL